MFYFVDRTNVPKTNAAAIWFESVIEFLKSKKNAPSLREVHFVDDDSYCLDIVKSYFDHCVHTHSYN